MGTSIFKAAARDAAQGHALSSKKLVNAPVSKRKAGYPNTYAAFEGAPVVKDGARFAELDGEALALVFDYKVGSVLFQRGILSTIRSVQSSFREAFFSRFRRRFSPLSERHPSFALDGGSALFQRGILLLHVPSDQAQEHPAPTDTSANSSKKPSSSLRPPFDHACHLMPPDDAPPPRFSRLQRARATREQVRDLALFWPGPQRSGAAAAITDSVSRRAHCLPLSAQFHNLRHAFCRYCLWLRSCSLSSRACQPSSRHWISTRCSPYVRGHRGAAGCSS